MMNDSVREELQTKIAGPGARSDLSARPIPAKKVEVPRPSPPLKVITAELSTSRTSPTLVEFQSRNAALPDWRLQLQNSVRQRMDPDGVRTERSARLVTNGANALKPEVAEQAEHEPEAAHADPRVANALRRIERSRNIFLNDGSADAAARPKAPRDFPFDVVGGNGGSSPRPPEGKLKLSDPPKPKLVRTFKIEKREYDTNKLPPIETVTAAAGVAAAGATDTPVAPEAGEPRIAAIPKPDISIRVSATEEVVPNLADTGEIEDLAPVSIRFNAALFDLIIGAFGSFIILFPLVFMGSEWFSVSGLIAFAAVWSMAMFFYLTVAIGMYGKTVGMRMFGLELIDAEENDYPTFHQAAVHSAVYLLSLPLLGAGFLPMLFNEEQRAAYDLVAGTIIVNEL